VLEARDRVGGRLWNTEIGGEANELGGEWVAPYQSRLHALLPELGVELFPAYREGEDVYVDDLVLAWIVDLVRATRQVEGVSTGASVRGSLTLERTARSWALPSLPKRSPMPIEYFSMFMPVP